MKDGFKLLIGYDGSPCSDAALMDLKRAGLPQRVEAVVATMADVFLPPNDEVAEDELVSPAAAAMMAHCHDAAAQTVQQALAIAKQASGRLRLDFPDWDVKAVAEADSPWWGLIKLAAELHPDLIVLGSHGHSSAGGRFIMGSVSLRVLYEASCSVRVARCAEQRDGPVRIAVGFDGSTAADAAVNSVAARSWPPESQVRVITAREASPPEKRAVSLEKLSAAGLVPSEITKDGEPAHVLVAEASEWGADAIFVGTRNLHGFQHLLQGSVSSAIAADARCSVEVVRAARAAAAA